MESTWTHVLFTALPSEVSPESVISFLHNHEALISLSPPVTSCERVERDDSQEKFVVQEEIDLLPFGSWKKTISFTVVFENRDGGVWSKVHAPLGFISEALYEVKRPHQETTVEVVDSNGEEITAEWVLKETVTSHCNMIFKAFVDASLVPTRRKLADKLMTKLRGIGHIQDN